jgi:predicted XRE-type DNA-binding protein
MTSSKSRQHTVTRAGDNIFRDLGFPPAEAENLRIRGELLAALQQVVHAYPTQAAAAERLAVTQPRISDIVRGKIELFSVDTIIELLGRAHIRVDVRIAPSAA